MIPWRTLSDPDVGTVGTLVGIAGQYFMNSTNTTCLFDKVAVAPKYFLSPSRIYVVAPVQKNREAHGAVITAFEVDVRCSNDGHNFSSGAHVFSYVSNVI